MKIIDNFYSYNEEENYLSYINKYKKIYILENNISIKLKKLFYFIIILIIIINCSFILKNKIFSSQKSNIININYFRKKFKALNQTYSSKKIKTLTLGKIYINECLKGLFINNNHKLPKYNITIISAIIHVYNCENSIKSSIRSIQNQNISNIEIILINDYSNDNSSKIIENLKGEDKRIIIINNNKNMGTLYSRCIGSIMSKGKYIFALDNDDMFFDEDIFDFIYKIAKEKNYDIVGFKSIYIQNYKDNITKMRDGYFSNLYDNLVLYQPKLGIYPISRYGRYVPNDYTIWAKCIKTEVYIKVINTLGFKSYSSFLSWGEDTSIVFIIFNIAKTFRFIHKYGIIHLRSFSTSTFTKPINNILFVKFFF